MTRPAAWPILSGERGDFLTYLGFNDGDEPAPGFLAWLPVRQTVPDEVIAKLDQAVRRQAAAIQARFPDQAK